MIVTIDKPPAAIKESEFMDYIRRNHGDKLRAAIREIGTPKR